MFPEEFMNILAALKQEWRKLQQQLKGVETAILALSGPHPGASRATVGSHKGVTRKRTMAAAGRARISKLTKARWAKFRAEKAKKVR
jgi:hypothetical protein